MKQKWKAVVAIAVALVVVVAVILVVVLGKNDGSKTGTNDVQGETSLEVITPGDSEQEDEVPVDSTDVSGAWGDESEDDTKTDSKTDSKSDSKTDSKNDSKNDSKDDNILQDDIEWGEIY